MDENQSDSFLGSIFDEPPDVNTVVKGWKRGKNTSANNKHYLNPPLVPENLDLTFLSDYIEYLSEGLKFIQYNNEITRRSELRYCSYLDKAVEIYREKTLSAIPQNDIMKLFLSESSDNNKDRAYLFKKKMVGKRLNKIISKCQLNWHIIDCVEELTVNFLTNTVQEENLNILINEINKEYTPKFLEKNSSINKFNELSQRAKARLSKIKELNLDDIDAQLKILQGTEAGSKVLTEFETLLNKYEFDIAEDEYEFESLAPQIEDEEFTEVMGERKDILSRFKTILENIKYYS